MKVSIIIPCYNAANTLQVQLSALARQKWEKPWEVILSDNGSTDESLSIADQYTDKLPNFQIVDSSKIRGPAFARNKGAQAARGESLLFCDADDEVATGWLASMGEVLETYDFVTCRFEAYKLNPSWAIKTRKCPQENGIQSYKYPPFLPHASGAAIGIKHSIHDAVGGFDHTMPMLEDTDYCWRVQLLGTQLVFVHNALLHYRFRSSMFKTLLQARLWGEYNVFLYRKYQQFGMEKLSKKTCVKNTLSLLKRMPFCLADSNRRNRWLWDLSWQYGRAVGSLKYRVFAL